MSVHQRQLHSIALVVELDPLLGRALGEFRLETEYYLVAEKSAVAFVV